MNRTIHSTQSQCAAPCKRRALILPVVLLILLLVGVLTASYAFRVSADYATLKVGDHRLQTTQAAMSGVERVKLMLVASRWDTTQWFSNMEELHRIVVWAEGADRTDLGTNTEYQDGRAAYRFSIVADEAGEDERFVRFGATDESARLNLNLATESQFKKLFDAVVEADAEIDTQAIINAILDWRDEDDESRGEEDITEKDYYENLDVPYRIKNGPFDTVEELLLVKGMTGRILYGEDFDRNGLLTPNEDDGDDSFPPDNLDGVLNRGLYPYLTTFSYENNVNNANRQRVDLFGDEGTLREELEELFPESPEVVNFVIAATREQQSGDGNNNGGGSRGGGRGGSRDGGGASGGRDGRGGRGGDRGAEPGQSDAPRDPDADSGDMGSGDQGRGDTGGGRNPRDGRGGTKAGPRGRAIDDKAQAMMQQAPVVDVDVEEEGEDIDLEALREQIEKAMAEEGGDRVGGATGVPGGPGSNRAIAHAADLIKDVTLNGQTHVSPLAPQDLAIILDNFTTIPPTQRKIEGLININTATRLVLSCIPNIAPETVDAILEKRSQVPEADRATIAWLLSQEVIEKDEFVKIAPYITARGQQFTIEALGYGDHIGQVTRLQVVVDMLGPIAQTIYQRDLTKLSGHYPIREEDLESLRVAN